MKKIFLIAEIGINHNGDLSFAKKLIYDAKTAGFDAVKFQKRDINLVYSKEILDSERISPWGKTQRDQKNGLEFGLKEYNVIDKYCKKINIKWLASAWDLNSLKFLDRYNLKYNKIASAMIVDKIFLQEVAQRKKYTFISTGMSTLKHISEAVKIFKKNKCKFELMHCVSTYPMEVEDANLNTINALKTFFKCPVGYSGHEIGLAVSYAAVGMGITSLERHITSNRAMYGSDQSASVEKKGMIELVRNIRTMELASGKNMLGHIHKKEIEISKKLRAHIKNFQGLK
jgi:N-acetylneuraminate synthase